MLIPRDNEKDLSEVPNKITKALNIHMIEHMDEVLQHALVKDKATQIAVSGDEDKEGPDEEETVAQTPTQPAGQQLN